MKRIQTLEIEQDLRFETKEWMVQRGAWTLMTVLIVAALLGLTGTGPLSHARVRQGGLEVGYQSICRQENATELAVQVNPPAQALVLPLSYVNKLEIERIVPQPDRTYTKDGHLHLEWDSAVDRIQFAGKPSQAGPLDGSISAGSTTAAFRQWVLP